MTRHVLATFAAMLLVSCAALPDDAPVVENLDPDSGVTIARLGHPLELYRETTSKNAADRFAFLGPFETNQMGRRVLYLWIALPMENAGGSPTPSVLVDGAPLTLADSGTTAEFAGLHQPPYKIPTPWMANFYFRIDADIVARLGAARELRIEAVDQAKDGPIGLQFGAQPGEDRRLPDFAAR
jgi:hypothetical protein